MAKSQVNLTVFPDNHEWELARDRTVQGLYSQVIPALTDLIYGKGWINYKDRLRKACTLLGYAYYHAAKQLAAESYEESFIERHYLSAHGAFSIATSGETYTNPDNIPAVHADHMYRIRSLYWRIEVAKYLKKNDSTREAIRRLGEFVHSDVTTAKAGHLCAKAVDLMGKISNRGLDPKVWERHVAELVTVLLQVQREELLHLGVPLFPNGDQLNPKTWVQ